MNEGCTNDEASYRKRLWSQITARYVETIFTRERHRQAELITTRKQSVISLVQITITALTSAGCLSVVITNSAVMAVVSTILSIALFGLNLYTRGAKLEELAMRYKGAADGLLAISQDYVSLLTDFDNLEIQDIIARRDDLQQRVDHINEMAPPLLETATKRAKDILQIGKIELLNAQDYSRLLPHGLKTRSQSQPTQSAQKQQSVDQERRSVSRGETKIAQKQRSVDQTETKEK